MTNNVVPFSLEGVPALIEKLLPVQKLSAEAYKEQMANVGKTLTALGSYWKGRKPLILNKACILGCLLPVTSDSVRDLEIFEMLMGMDDVSFAVRWPRRPKPKEILAVVSLPKITDYFVVEPAGVLPEASPVDDSNFLFDKVKVSWRQEVTELERRKLEAKPLSVRPYRQLVDEARRAEEVMDEVYEQIWDRVNCHLGTNAYSMQELVEQLGVMRYGHRPRLADTFCGSGQIPFEAVRLGCDVFASDLNPIACMLTWGAFNIVGGTAESRMRLIQEQSELVEKLYVEVDSLGIETDGNGWMAKTFLYCLEARCPQSGWLVPLLPTCVISKGKRAVAVLEPDHQSKRYQIRILTGASESQLAKASVGTVRSDGRGLDAYMVHTIDGVEYRTKISTLRGDYRTDDGSTGNKLRLWEKHDFKPRPDDIFQERLYAIQWMRPKNSKKTYDYEFRSVTGDDLEREALVEHYVAEHLLDWQAKGWIPDMRIEPGYNTDQPTRERGWTYWHHLFNPRQLLINGLINRFADRAALKFGVSQAANWNSRLSPWNNAPGGDSVNNTFYNQALNTLLNYGTRSSRYVTNQIKFETKHFPLLPSLDARVQCVPASEVNGCFDVLVTDPPYGDAVNYDEILEYFIAWLRKNPPPEFADWVWDSRRALAIKGEDEEFRRAMVAAYRRMAACMSDNGIQVVMFTHQSGTIWADMANIVWASGLHVTAAWYVATETNSALREGSYVKGTVLLVLRKRAGTYKTTRDELGWELQEEVDLQVQALTGLNQQAKGLYRDENVFEDADIRMAGYAAALRVLTRYAVIDGRDMTIEASRPRLRGEATFVDSLIAFAVDTANRSLVPQGIEPGAWNRLSGAERFYLKLIDMETHGTKTLDNYQNFAKAFKVRDYRALMGSQRANSARLKSALEFDRSEMGEGSELHDSVLRAVLYAIMELVKNLDSDLVLKHLALNVPNYYGDMTQRQLAIELADYLAGRLPTLRPDEASAARILSESIKNKRLG